MNRTIIGELVKLGIPFAERGQNVVLGTAPNTLSEGLIERLRAAKPTLCDAAHRLHDLVFVDFETRSPVSLSKAGPRGYIEHADFEVLCLVAILPDGRQLIWTPKLPPPLALFQAVCGGAAVVAHNAHGFDRLVWEKLGWPAPAEWIDSLPLARVANLPGGLDDLGERVLGVGKDRAGRQLTLEMSRIDRRTGRLPVLDAATSDRIAEYCSNDVLLLRGVYAAELALHRTSEPDVRAVDVVINERGFAFDERLARAIIHMENELISKAQRDAPVSGTILTSPRQLRSWLEGVGLHARDTRRSTLQAFLEDPDTPDVARAVLIARLISSGITSKKLTAGLKLQERDGRIRRSLVYCAAHTGRWAGRGIQPQNLPRGLGLEPDHLAELVDLVADGDLQALHDLGHRLGAAPSALLGTLVRACIVAPSGKALVTADYAQIEARVLLWLAGDLEGLRPFVVGPDPYKDEASRLFGVPVSAVSKVQRSLGKVMVLGCGFGVGPDSFAPYAASMRVDWSAVGVSPSDVVEGWRNAHPAIAGTATGTYRGHTVRTGGIWKDIESAALRVVRTGRQQVAARCEWRLDAGVLVCRLPSGRELRYRDPEVHAGRFGRPQLSYLHRKTRVTTYGGKLTENVTQAVARDILADALVRLEGDLMCPVLHVHDEVVCEVDSSANPDHIKAICERTPAWAAGLPVQVEVGQGARYTK